MQIFTMITSATSPAAKFCSRTIAFLIDIVTLLVILGTFAMVAMGTLLHMLPENPADLLVLLSLTGMWSAICPVMLIPAYFIVFHSLGGATPGKIFMGIKVVNADNKTIRPGISFLRAVGYVLSGLPLAAGLVWILIDENSQAWHDKLAGTRVIYS